MHTGFGTAMLRNPSSWKRGESSSAAKEYTETSQQLMAAQLALGYVQLTECWWEREIRMKPGKQNLIWGWGMTFKPLK